MVPIIPCARWTIQGGVPFVLGAIMVLTGTPPVFAAKLHIVVAVDHQAEKVGADLNDGGLPGSLWLQAPPGVVEIYRCKETLSEPEILQTIRNVPVQPDDALMFIYVGHGAYDPSRGTYMTPSSSTGDVLSATQMVNELKALNPRLAVVVFDCCNRERAPKPTKLTFAAPGAVLPKQVSPLLDELFFRTHGSVLAVSSSPGEYALVRARRDTDNGHEEPPVGPLFMNALSATVHRNQNQRLKWSQLFNATQAQLDLYFRKLVGEQGRLSLDSGEQVQQERQTIQLRFYR